MNQVQPPSRPTQPLPALANARINGAPSAGDSKAKGLGRRVVTKIEGLLNHIAFQVSLLAIAIIAKSVKLSHHINTMLYGERISSKAIDFSGSSEIKKVFSFIGLITVPLTLKNIATDFYHFIREVQQSVVDHKSSQQLVNASLLAIASLGDLLEIPGKIAGVVDLFQPVAQIGIWSGSLSIIASVFAFASLAHSWRMRKETQAEFRQLEQISNQAFMTRLQEMITSENDPVCKAALQNFDQSFVSQQVETYFTQLNSASSDPKQLQKLVHNLKVQMYATTSPETEDLLAKLELVGQMAFLDCLKQKDEAFLKKHFSLGSQHIEAALKAIHSESKATDVNEVHRLLKGSISETINSLEVKMVVDLVNIVAGVILAAVALGLSASPLAPIGYALVVGILMFVVVKAIMDYEAKKQHEEELNIVAERAAPPVPPRDYQIEELTFERRLSKA